MPAVTALDLITDMYAVFNVYIPGESVDPNMAQVARRYLNRMLNTWSQRTAMIPVIARERFDMIADKGGPDNPYTIGDGGDFDTERPSNQGSITAANLILTNSDPEVRVPLGIYTDDAYDANQIPDMSNSQPTGLYYNPTYAGGLGSIFLWPVPNTAQNDLELFLQKSVSEFADLSTTYYVPDGLPEALVYNLAKRMQSIVGRQMSADDKLLAIETLGVFTRSNLKISDLMNDAYVFTYGRRTMFNINTGAGG
jgi:hypothetical protein